MIFFHVGGGARRPECVARGDADDGNGSWTAFDEQVGAVDGVDGQVYFGAVAVAYFLAAGEKGTAVYFALFTDDDTAVHVQCVQSGGHGARSRPVGGPMIA